MPQEKRPDIEARSKHDVGNQALQSDLIEIRCLRRGNTEPERWLHNSVGRSNQVPDARRTKALNGVNDDLDGEVVAEPLLGFLVELLWAHLGPRSHF